MIELRTELLLKAVECVGDDITRYFINGIRLFDKDKHRYYVGTNGHIMVEFREPIKKMEIKKPITIAITKKNVQAWKKKATVSMKINKSNVQIEDILIDIINADYPDYKNVIPTHKKLAKKYTMFAPEYTGIIKKYFKDAFYSTPYMEDEKSPAMWAGSEFLELKGKKKSYIKYTLVLMPVRVS